MDRSPFNAVPDEIVLVIFSHVRDIKQKLGLDLVCKRFRACNLKTDAWSRNTFLCVGDSHNTLPYCEKLLSRVKEITHLEIEDCEVAALHQQELLAIFEPNATKLKLESLEYTVDDDNTSFVVWCLHQSTKTLKEVKLSPAFDPQAAIYAQRPILEALADCNCLSQAFIEFAYSMDGELLTAALLHKPLKWLLFEGWRAFATDRLVRILNSTRNGGLENLVISDQYSSGWFARLDLVTLCNSLEVEAAANLNHINIDIFGSYLRAIPILPLKFPKLKYFKMIVFSRRTDSIQLAHQLSKFLAAAGPDREIKLILYVVGGTEGSNLMPALKLLAASSAGQIKLNRLIFPNVAQDPFGFQLRFGLATVEVDIAVAERELLPHYNTQEDKLADAQNVIDMEEGIQSVYFEKD